MTTTTFAEQVALLVASTYSASSVDLVPLATLLGLRSGGFINAIGDQGIRRPAQPPAGSEPLVRATLLTALRHHCARKPTTTHHVSLIILGGLATNERWRECLHTADDAYDFATLLTHFGYSVSASPPGSDLLLDAIKQDVVAMLSAWCEGVAFSASSLYEYTVPLALFGDVWCDLVLDVAGLNAWDVAAFVHAKRPEFLPGLLPPDLDLVHTGLPVLPG